MNNNKKSKRRKLLKLTKIYDFKLLQYVIYGLLNKSLANWFVNFDTTNMDFELAVL